MSRLKAFLQSSSLEPELISCERAIRPSVRLITRDPECRSLARAVIYALASELQLAIEQDGYGNVQIDQEFRGIFMNFRAGLEPDAEAEMDIFRQVTLKLWTRLSLTGKAAPVAPELLELLASEAATLVLIKGIHAPSLGIGKAASLNGRARRALVYAVAAQAEFGIPPQRLWRAEPLPDLDGIRLHAWDLDHVGARSLLGCTAVGLMRAAHDRGARTNKVED